MAEFQPALERTMKFEDFNKSGVVTGEPNGGRARFGINEKYHPDLPEEFWTGPADDALSLAESILEREYWEKPKLAQIENQDVANKVFDMAVNMGVGQAAIYAQRAVNHLHQIGQLPASVKEDGALGPKSFEAINAANPVRLITVLREISESHYRHLAAVNPKQLPNLPGWLRRAAA